MLSNDACKFMIPNISDWVELYAINPDEYYMSQHLQDILSYIALRISVNNNNMNKNKQFQLNYNIFIKHKINIKALYYSYQTTTSITSKISSTTITSNAHNNNNNIHNNNSSSGSDSYDKHSCNNDKKRDNENDDNIVRDKTFQQIKDKIDEYQVWMYDIDHLYHDDDDDDSAVDDRTVSASSSSTTNIIHSNINNNNNNSNLNNNLNNTLFNLSFDPWSIQINYPITLTRGNIIKKCLCRVRLTLIYNNQLLQSKIKISTNGDLNNHSKSNDDKNNKNDGNTTTTTNNNNIANYQLTYDQFKQTELITHIKLHIIPSAIDFISIIPTAIMTIDILTIQYLLRHIYPDGFDINDIFSSNSIASSNSASSSSSSSSSSGRSSNSNSIDNTDTITTNSTHHCQVFMKYLISMIKIDNTDDGIKYSIVGAFSKPNYINCPWSYDNDDVMYKSNDDDDDDDEIGNDNDTDGDFNNIKITVDDVK